MPVEFGSLASVIMGDKLDEQGSALRKKGEIAKPEIPPVFSPCKVVIAGKCTGELKLSKEFSMKKKSVVLKERFFVFIRPENENLLTE
jgi:hypothetical protein